MNADRNQRDDDDDDDDDGDDGHDDTVIIESSLDNDAVTAIM